MENQFENIETKLNIAPQNVHFAMQFIDSLMEIICQISEREARKIRHGATYLTGSKDEVNIMGGVDALSSFGVLLNGMKSGIYKEYQEFIKKQNEEAEAKKKNSAEVKEEETETEAA